jgi:rubrerythrin
LFRAAATAEATHDATHQRAILKLGGEVERPVIAEVVSGTTIENLKKVVEGESYERDTMYPDFLKLAKKEDAKEAIQAFTYAGAVEKQHAALFAEALSLFGHNPVVDYYVCPVCGETEAGAPDKKKCPTCRQPTADFVKVL